MAPSFYLPSFGVSIGDGNIFCTYRRSDDYFMIGSLFMVCLFEMNGRFLNRDGVENHLRI